MRNGCLKEITNNGVYMRISKKRMIYIEQVTVFVLLTFIGGFLDAYTYILRGGVFANAQTGNLVLFGVNAAKGNIRAAHYLFPVITFMVGVFVSKYLKDKISIGKQINYRLVILLMEMLTVFFIGFVPPTANMNDFTNIIISFITALQYSAFRTINGLPFASTMCSGMLRSVVDYFYAYTGDTKNKDVLKICALYFFIIITFCIGCVVGCLLSLHLLARSIWICASIFIFVIIVFLLEKKARCNMPEEYDFL